MRSEELPTSFHYKPKTFVEYNWVFKGLTKNGYEFTERGFKMKF